MLPEAHPLSRLYLVDSHARDHGGVDSMVMRSRSSVWIMAARRLAKQVRDRCFTCRYLAKKCGEQLMGPLPEHGMGPAPVFESTAVDLFGPLSFQDPYNKRRTGKAWGVVFMCTATSLIHVEVTESYSTDSFLMALRRFMTVHGAPGGSSRIKVTSWWRPPSSWRRGTGPRWTSCAVREEQHGDWCPLEGSITMARQSE